MLAGKAVLVMYAVTGTNSAKCAGYFVLINKIQPGLRERERERGQERERERAGDGGGGRGAAERGMLRGVT